MRAHEFIIEDRETMLKYIRANYSQWDLEEFQQELDRLAQLGINNKWKEEIHTLVLKTTEASKLIPWKQDFNDDLDRFALRDEYIELAEKILMYYHLRKPSRNSNV
jgi:adenosine deaminase